MTAIVKIDNISKKFARSLKKAMVYGLIDIAKASLIPHRFRSDSLTTRMADGRPPGSHFNMKINESLNHESERLRDTEFWAVRNVSFELRRGECLGLIGHNGAGKSTIFKMLSGIYGPTHGSIAVQGRLSALLEVGAGFHPMLTGRENIYISGSIRGMTNDEIERKYDQIVAFSGIEDFIDMPIKFYSSGMLVRLGFAVLAHLEPDVLLIDEILAVGDMDFQKQCIDHVNKLRASDMALALVSHSLYRIESLCDRTIWLDRGAIKMAGDTREVIKAYRNEHISKHVSSQPGSHDEGPLVASNALIIKAVKLLDQQGKPSLRVGYGDPIRIVIAYKALKRIERPIFHLIFKSQGVRAFEAGMLLDGNCPNFIDGDGELQMLIESPNVLPNAYDMELVVRSQEGAVDLVEQSLCYSFQVTIDGLDGTGLNGPYAIGHLSHGCICLLNYTWDLSKK